jgi:pilus assembly protein CpaF
MTREEIFQATTDTYLAPVDQFRQDQTVTEIMINGPDEVYIERNGRLELTDVKFHDPELLQAIARNLAQYTNKRITPTTSRFDSRLPDGSRVHVMMPRCSSQKGLCISIRKFVKSGFSLEGMVAAGSLTPEIQEYLEIIVALERNIIVSGGTGTGKTSFLNALSQKIPSSERIIVIEDTSELKLQQPHVLSFETAAPDRHGDGAVTIRDLFHSALRMRPDRIVIGECRGGEALDLVQAMTSGHGGSMSTLHADAPADALSRLETMALMSGVNLPLGALRPQIASAIDVVVQLTRTAEGRRVVTEISETHNELSASGDYKLNPVFIRHATHGETRLQHTGRQSIFAGETAVHDVTSRVRLTRTLFG